MAIGSGSVFPCPSGHHSYLSGKSAKNATSPACDNSRETDDLSPRIVYSLSNAASQALPAAPPAFLLA